MVPILPNSSDRTASPACETLPGCLFRHGVSMMRQHPPHTLRRSDGGESLRCAPPRHCACITRDMLQKQSHLTGHWCRGQAKHAASFLLPWLAWSNCTAFAVRIQSPHALTESRLRVAGGLGAGQEEGDLSSPAGRRGRQGGRESPPGV